MADVSPENWKALKKAEEAKRMVTGQDFVEMSPEQWKQLQANPQVDVAPQNEIQQAQDFREPYTMDPRYIGAASALATGVGGAYGGLIKGTVGAALRGGVAAGLTGGLSATGGEYVKETMGDTNLARAIALGTEAAVGTWPSAIREVAARAPSAGILAVTQNYPLAKTIQTISGGRSQSDIFAREKIFGKDTIKAGVPTTKFQTEAQENILKGVEDLGIKIQPKETPVDALKRSLYADMDKLSIDSIEKPGPLGVAITGSSAPVTVTSKGVKDIAPILKNGLVASGAKPRELFAIRNILLKQTDKNPTVREAAHKELLTLIQQGGFFDKRTGNLDVILSPSTQDALKAEYGNYINKTQGRDVYSTLVDSWRQEFNAKAMDDIPQLITGGFKGKDLEGALNNIKQHPEGKRLLRTAVASYFKTLPEEQVAKEWINLKNVLDETNALDTKTLSELNQAVGAFTSKTATGKFKDMSANALKMSIIKGVLPTEAANLLLQENPVQDVFNM
jgi:hypothetical protein